MRQRKAPYLALVVAGFGVVLALIFGQTAHASTRLQTIPTRTPTSGPTATASPPEPTAPGGDAQPTGAAPSQTPLASPGATPGADATRPPASGSSQSTPGPLDCQSPAMAIALEAIDVLEQPREDSLVIGNLAFQETRPLLGRTFDAQWWLLQYRDNQNGWVSQQQVQLQGCIDLLPVLDDDAAESGSSGAQTEAEAVEPGSAGQEERVGPGAVDLNAESRINELTPAPLTTPGSDEPVGGREGTPTTSVSGSQSKESARTGPAWLLILGGLLFVGGAILLLASRTGQRSRRQ